jgi:hypothetical protein
MSKITGATLHFWFGGVEIPVNSATFEGAWSTIETTDSATPSPATEFIVNRAARTTKVEADLMEADGAEETTGTCIALQRYKVTGGTITETQGTFPNGSCFTSDGTGTISGTNKVKKLGDKLPGKGATCTVGGNSTGVVSMKFQEAYGEFDVTDTTTSGDGMETVVGRVTRTGNITLIMKDTVADLVTADPAPTAIVLTLGTGITITGNAIFTKKGISSLAKGDAVQVSYDMSWVGPVTIVASNQPTLVTSTACIIKWKPGSSTSKGVSGNAIVTGRSIETDVNGLAKATFDMKWDGAVTETVYS